MANSTIKLKSVTQGGGGTTNGTAGKAIDALIQSQFPGSVITYGPTQAVDKGLNAQKQAVSEAQRLQEEYFDFVKKQNQNVIDSGDKYLDMLRKGIESGAFDMDEGMFNAYQQYVVPEYEAGGLYENQERPYMMAPDMYRYNQNRADAPQYQAYQDQQQQPAPVQSQQLSKDIGAQQYIGKGFSFGQQRPADFRNTEFKTNLQRQDAGQYQQGQRQQYEEAQVQPWQNTTFNGQKYNENYQQYQGQQAPQARNVSDQFQTQQYQQQQNRPDAPQAEYFDPNAQQFQSKEFRIEDDPVYQRRLELSGKAIENSAARDGMQLSGATLKALQENAQGIAAEEGDAAYQRWNQQDQTGYGRFQDQQQATSEASRYKNQDQYNRYLDQQQQFESDRLFGADQNKEAFLREQATKQLGRELNNEEFSRWLQTDGQQYAQFADQRDWSTSQSNMNADRDWQQYTYEKGFGRDVYADDRNNAQSQAQLRNQYNTDTYNSDRAFEYQQNQDQQNRYDSRYQQDYQNLYNSNQAYQDRGMNLYGMQNDNYNQDFQNALNASRFNNEVSKSQYDTNNANRIDTRNFNANQQNQQFLNDLAAYNANIGQYNTNRQFGADQNAALNNFGFDTWAAQNQNYNTDRQFGADQYQQNYQNIYDVWDAQNANMTQDNQLKYNAWATSLGNNADMYKYNTDLGYQQNQDFYNRLVDSYNRQDANKQNKYTRIGDITNYGMQGRQNVVSAGGNYADTMGDLALQSANAQAAYYNSQPKGLLGNIKQAIFG